MSDSARERAEHVADERTFHVGIRVARNVARDLLAALERVDALEARVHELEEANGIVIEHRDELRGRVDALTEALREIDEAWQRCKKICAMPAADYACAEAKPVTAPSFSPERSVA